MARNVSFYIKIKISIKKGTKKVKGAYRSKEVSIDLGDVNSPGRWGNFPRIQASQGKDKP
jgi:hypothetical protein